MTAFLDVRPIEGRPGCTVMGAIRPGVVIRRLRGDQSLSTPEWTPPATPEEPSLDLLWAGSDFEEVTLGLQVRGLQMLKRQAKGDDMYQRTIQMAIGTGVAADLLTRIHSDLATPTAASSGFLAYYAVKIDDATVISTRIFEDSASMDAETQVTNAVTTAIATDFDLTISAVVDGEVGVGIAFGPRSEFAP